MAEPANINIPYPWQQPAWSRIQQLASRGRLPHAILLSGQFGIGKWHFAESLADYLLCRSPKADLACGQCRSCQLINADTHPDKRYFIPEYTDKPIKIDQIRELSTYVGKTAQLGGRKLVLLGPVEQLNINAANALLKNLEEPAGDTVFILTTHVLSGVMATIRSRCQLFPMATPDNSVAVEWLEKLKINDAQTLLQLAGGAPIVARDMVEGDYLEHLGLFISTLDTLSQQNANQRLPADIGMASDWVPIGVKQITQWWLQIIHQLVQHSFVSSDSASLVTDGAKQHSEISEAMQRVLVAGRSANRKWLFKFQDKLLLLRRQVLDGANPNLQLLIEELLLDWQAIIKQS